MKKILRQYRYCSFELTCLVDGKGKSSADMLKKIIQSFKDKDRPPELFEIDRNEKRTGEESRRLVNVAARFGKEGKRVFGRIALIKNKAPQFLVGKDIVEEIKKPENSKFIEQTSYIIDFTSSEQPIMIFEFNSSGPRLSDITYFFRQHMQHFHIGRGIKHTEHLEIDTKGLDKRLKDVFSINVKVKAAEQTKYGKAEWFKSLIGIKEETGYKDIRLDLSFARPNPNSLKKNVNIIGVNFARKLIQWTNLDKNNFKALHDLKMEYQDDSGEIIELDFLKNKVTSCIEVNKLVKSEGEIRKAFEHEASQELNYYLTHGIVKNECKKHD